MVCSTTGCCQAPSGEMFDDARQGSLAWRYPEEAVKHLLSQVFSRRILSSIPYGGFCDTMSSSMAWDSARRLGAARLPSPARYNDGVSSSTLCRCVGRHCTAQCLRECTLQQTRQSLGGFMASQPRLFDQMQKILRLKPRSCRTEEASIGCVTRCMLFHDTRHPKDMGAVESRAFLASLTTHEQGAASTQHGALNALLFLYRSVLTVQFYSTITCNGNMVLE
jgi:Phage integrase, N-terminal SAM-like domain